MTYWPEPVLMPAHQLTITPYSATSISDTEGIGIDPVSGVIGGSNTGLAWPFRLARPMTAKTAFWMNGATVAGNIIVGIYGAPAMNPTDSQPRKLVETSSTAQSGTNVIQSVSIGPTYLRPGLYYIALILSDGTATLFRSAGMVAQEARHVGLWRITLGSFALPTTLNTPNAGAFNTAMIPFGIAAQTVI